jgi:hypothetical protein
LDALGGALAVVGADRFGTVSIESIERVCPRARIAVRVPQATCDAISAAPDNCLAARTESVQSSSLLTVRLHRLNFYVVLWKLIPKLQPFSQCIQKAPMTRFYSSIYADDKTLIKQTSCDSAFHGSPHQIAAAHRTKTECIGSVPDVFKSRLIRVENSLFLVLRRDISGRSCGKVGLRQQFSRFFRRQNLSNTGLIGEVFAF